MTSLAQHSWFHAEEKNEFPDNDVVVLPPAHICAKFVLVPLSRWQRYQNIIQFIVLLLSLQFRFRLISMRSESTNNIHSKMCRVFWCCTFHLIRAATEDTFNRNGNDRCNALQKLVEITLLEYSFFSSFAPCASTTISTSALAIAVPI